MCFAAEERQNESVCPLLPFGAHPLFKFYTTTYEQKHHPGYCRYRFPAGKNHKQKTRNNTFRKRLPSWRIIKKTIIPVLNTIFHGYDAIFINDKKAFNADTSGKTTPLPIQIKHTNFLWMLPHNCQTVIKMGYDNLSSTKTCLLFFTSASCLN